MQTVSDKYLSTIFKGEGTFIVSVDERTGPDALIDVILAAQQRGQEAIVVLFREPYSSFHERAQERHVPEEGVHVIDAISDTVKPEGERYEGVRYLSSPTNLRNVGVVVSALLTKNEDAVVVFDSLQAINSYNDARKMKRAVKDFEERTETSGTSFIVFNDLGHINDLVGSEELYFGEDPTYLGPQGNEIEVIGADGGGLSVRIPAMVQDELGWSDGDILRWRVKGKRLTLRKGDG